MVAKEEPAVSSVVKEVTKRELEVLRKKGRHVLERSFRGIFLGKRVNFIGLSYSELVSSSLSC